MKKDSTRAAKRVWAALLKFGAVRVKVKNNYVALHAVNLIIGWLEQREDGEPLLWIQGRLQYEDRRIAEPGRWLFMLTKHMKGMQI